MKATLEPLNGKYYGTKITIADGPLAGRGISLWFANGEPSCRELASWGYTQEQWDSNALVDDGWGGLSPIKSLDLICDSHYECKDTLRIAEAIIETLKAL